MPLHRSLAAVAFAAALILPACTLAQGMGGMSMPSGAKTGSNTMVAPSQVFDKMLSGAESEFVGAASAMPADKFNFAPSASMGKYDGVRTFAAEIKHVTEANYYYGHAFGGGNAKSRADIEKLTSRDEILQALKDSFAYLHAGIATITPMNAFADTDGKGTTRAGAAAGVIAHMNDHYGQMVEYLRMNGLVPPASQR